MFSILLLKIFENHNSLMVTSQITTFCNFTTNLLTSRIAQYARTVRQGTKGLDVKAERGQMCRAEAAATGQGPSAVDHLGKNPVVAGHPATPRSRMCPGPTMSH